MNSILFKKEPSFSPTPNSAFPKAECPDFPVQVANSILSVFNLKVVHEREKTGLEESENLKLRENMIVAGRYQVKNYLGSAAFSQAFSATDIKTDKQVCLKLITNKKDYFDQAIDEIKILKYLQVNGDPQKHRFISMLDYFYFKEHMFLVFELLDCTLYELQTSLFEGKKEHFSEIQVASIAKQLLVSLEFMHSLRLIHCDLKPENVMVEKNEDLSVKLIDMGSTCFLGDNVGFYVQSRTYRAPEVLMECDFDAKIDIWSLGCILFELFTGNVLFHNIGVESLLARMMGILGPIPDWMFNKGRKVSELFTVERLIVDKAKEDKISILVPKKSSLEKRLRTENQSFLDFMEKLLKIDPNERLSATEALKHPFLN